MKLKLQLLLRRIRGFDFKRMSVYIDEVKKETRMPRFLIFLDMVLCILFYNVGFFDYHIFGFVHIRSPKKRRTFFTMQDNWKLCRLVNNPEDKPYFENKLKFCAAFSDMLGREFLDLRTTSPETLLAFLNRHPVSFLKAPEGFGGLEVSCVESAALGLKDAAEAEALRVKWCEAGRFLLEEGLKQHPALSALYPHSLNTLRISTLTDSAGEAHILYVFIRTGVNGACVDNTTSGGISTLLCADGVIRTPAISDKTGLFHDTHPDTGVSFIGFEVPFFEESLALCKRAAKVRPGMRYVGWDIGITPDGPVLVEGNDLPAYDGQNYRQVEHPGTGMKPLIRSIVPEI